MPLLVTILLIMTGFWLGYEIKRKVDAMTVDLSKLTAAVAKQQTVTASALSFISGLKDELAKLKDKLDDPDVDSQAAIDSLVAGLDAQADQLASALTENTPAANEEPTSDATNG